METVTFDGITLSFYLNRDGTINLRKEIRVVYKNQAGIKDLFYMTPVHPENRGGLIKDQIQEAKKQISIRESLNNKH